MQYLNAIGIGFQLLGSLAVALGIYDTLKSFRDRGGRWHYQDRLSVWWNWIRRYLLRRPPVTVRGEVRVNVGWITSTASGFAPICLPDPSVDPSDFKNRVETALNDLLSRAMTAQTRLERERLNREADLKSVRTDIETAKEVLDDQIQEVDVGGIRLEALGLGFVVVGTLLSAFG